MIHPSDKWRFVEPLGDKGFFEDDVVQHIVTEHRALRRAMSERASADPVCLEEVTQQASLAATYTAPALPRIYCMETVRGRATIIMELVTGAPLDDEINHQKFIAPYEWASFASKLIDELLELRQCSTRFHKLDSEHIVLQDSGDIRITSRWPVGTVQPPTLEASPLLQRMVEQQRVGVYTSTAPANEAGEVEAVKNILTRMAAGSTRHSFEQLREEVRRAPNMHSSALAGVDVAIARILMGMHPRPDGTGEFTNLFNVQAVVKRLCEDEARRIAEAKAQMASFRSGAHHQGTTPTFGGQGTPIDSPVARSSSPHVPIYRDPVTGAPKDPVTGSYREVAGALREAAHHTPAKDPPSHGSGQRPAITTPHPHSPDEDLNPYAPPPAMVHAPGTGQHAPARDPISGSVRRDSRSGQPVRNVPTEDVNPYAVAAKDEPSGRVLQVGPARTHAPAAPVYRPPSNVAKKIIPIVIAIIVIGAGVVFILPMLKSKPPNTKPVALIAPMASSTATVNEIVTIDASGTKDGENDKLTYYWEQKAPADGRVSLTESGTSNGGERKEFATQASRIDAQFFTSGDFKLELKVGDGQSFSDPVTVDIKVIPKK
ncbi:hypothetical protein IT570_04960 [Candidatus Sumerlaeota bacterium]|nr:hypothetical protein [Candidatus Sumerlaeota bacterium]